jgi:hypothetical protein
MTEKILMSHKNQSNPIPGSVYETVRILQQKYTYNYSFDTSTIRVNILKWPVPVDDNTSSKQGPQVYSGSVVMSD